MEATSNNKLNKNIAEKLTRSINIPLNIGPNAIPSPNVSDVRFITFPSTSYSAAILIVNGNISVHIYLKA